MEQTYLYFIIPLAVVLVLILIILLRRNSAVHQNKTGRKVALDNLPLKLGMTRTSLWGKVADLLNRQGKFDDEILGDLTEVLIQADVGVKTSEEIISRLQNEIRQKKISAPEMIKASLKEIITELLNQDYAGESLFQDHTSAKPYVILFAGVNGTGKTTTIGKLAWRFRQEGKKVLLVAADTFRAAAAEQLTIWSQKAEAQIIRQQAGADPASLVFDALTSAVHQDYDVVLIDTAGRQHTRINLMNELAKIQRTIRKILPQAPHEILMVIDATTGQNAVTQVDSFRQSLDLTGLVLTKLDGTAKGGIIIGIKHQLGLPVKLIGVGETVNDLREFRADEFLDAVLAE